MEIPLATKWQDQNPQATIGDLWKYLVKVRDSIDDVRTYLEDGGELPYETHAATMENLDEDLETLKPIMEKYGPNAVIADLPD